MSDPSKKLTARYQAATHKVKEHPFGPSLPPYNLPPPHPEDFEFMDDSDLVKALAAPERLTKHVLDNLLCRMSAFDCEEWDVEVGLAIVERLSRELEEDDA